MTWKRRRRGAVGYGEGKERMDGKEGERRCLSKDGELDGKKWVERRRK